MGATLQRDVTVAHALAWITTRGITVRSWTGQPDPDLGRVDHPTLYLVEPDGSPPPTWGELEDWVRMPTSHDELQHRADRLLVRHAERGNVLATLDDDDVLHVAGRLVVLSPLEARIVRTLLANQGRFTPRDALEEAVWTDPPTTRWALDNRLRSLRRRLADLPLRIHTVRGKGLLLATSEGDRLLAS